MVKIQRPTELFVSTQTEEAPKSENDFSVSFAAGLKIDYTEKNGFSMKVMTPQDIVEEHEKSKKTINTAWTPTGKNLNIYC